MSIMRAMKALAPIDLHNIRRDPMLKWMMLAPFLFAALIRFLIPLLQEILQTVLGFDLTPYYPLLMGYGFVVMLPMLFGMVIGFLLLDERDEHTLIALQVTPLPLWHYMSYRVMLPIILSLLLTVVTYPLAGLLPMATGRILLVALLSAPLAPIFALYIAAVAQNKVQGFALIKISGGLFMLPVAAYFVAEPWQWLFGIIPSYWPTKLFWTIAENSSTSLPLIIVCSVIVEGVMLLILLNRFDKIMHR